MDILITKRLTLRPILAPDAPDIAHWLANPNVARMLSRVPQPYTAADGEAYAALCRKQTDDLFFGIHRERLIGVVSIERRESAHELGYWLAEPHWGRGIMSEAARALVDHAFTTRDYETVASSAMVDNPASLRIQGKLGFVRTGTRPLVSRARGQTVMTIRTILTRAAWAAWC